jgi:hypothetical protein
MAQVAAERALVVRERPGARDVRRAGDGRHRRAVARVGAGRLESGAGRAPACQPPERHAPGPFAEERVREGTDCRIVRGDHVEDGRVLVRRAAQQATSPAERQNPDQRSVPACREDAKLAAAEGAPPGLDPAGVEERGCPGPRGEVIPLGGDGLEARGSYAGGAEVSAVGQRLTGARTAPPSGRRAP